MPDFHAQRMINLVMIIALVLIVAHMLPGCANKETSEFELSRIFNAKEMFARQERWSHLTEQGPDPVKRQP